jgi:PhzF family phenazine biosynthesis protein
MDLAFRILNVFTIGAEPFSGNPLAVFEDGRGLDDAAMQGLARQLNLAETTFLLPAGAAGATARVRIFTPGFEMPFAGHPTLGSAHVVRALGATGDRVTLEMQAGLVEVTAAGDRWTLRAARPPRTRPPAAEPDQLAAMMGLPPGSVRRPLWVDTGVEQLILPVATPAQVRAVRPDLARLERHARPPGGGEVMVHAWAASGPGRVEARFFAVENGGLVEDPATGSACANLGGWHVATGSPRPVSLTIEQGGAVGRPSRLGLAVDAGGAIFVSGEVLELGRGLLRLERPAQGLGSTAPTVFTMGTPMGPTGM